MIRLPARVRATLTFWAAYWAGTLLTSAVRRTPSPTKENPDELASR